jgi:hypothetical protein
MRSLGVGARGAVHRQSLFCERLSGTAARTTPPAAPPRELNQKQHRDPYCFRRLADVDVSTNDRFAPIVLKNSMLKPTVIADSFSPVGAGDRIDDGSAAG